MGDIVRVDQVEKLIQMGYEGDDLIALVRALAISIPEVEPKKPSLDGAARMRAYRERKKNGTVGKNVTVTSHPSPLSTKEAPHTPQENIYIKTPLEEGEQKAVTPASPFPDREDLDLALDAYNQVSASVGVRKCISLTEARKAKLKRRLLDCGSLEAWYEVCRKLQNCPFLHGDNDRGWRADFDFLLQESSFNRLREGFYDGKTKVQRY